MNLIQKVLSIVLITYSFGIYAQEFEITGKVIDENNYPITDANITIQGISQNATTDDEGNYTLSNIPKGTYTISASYVGYNPESKTITINKNSVINFRIQQGVVLEGLTVTAQKREQSIKDIPSALTSLSGSFIENLNITEIANLADYMPGVQMQVQSPNNPGFVVRGITSDDGASNIEPRVSVFQDGVSISKSRGSVVEIFDMERVEVLKGPQGTLFGRGAQIGALHLIQNKPKNYLEGAENNGVEEESNNSGLLSKIMDVLK